MARGKKKETTLTPEEKLAQVLVPNWEQPYKVPKNWIWSYIGSGYEVTSSKRVHKDDWLSEGIPFYRTRELVKLSEYGYVDNELFISENQYEEYKDLYGVPRVGDLLISGVGTIGVPYVVNSDSKFYFKDGNIIWFKNKGPFLPQYTYYLYKSLFMDDQIHGMSSGTTVDTYTIINANNTRVPVPPIREQQRIVDRIEGLFTKLDEAKEKAQSVLDSFETRKAAILHQAFTGKLTAKWRSAHNVTMDSWEQLVYSDIGTSKLGKMLDKAKNEGFPIPYLRNINVRWFGFDLNDVSTMLASEAEIASLSVKQGDLFICEGGEPGRCAIWKEPDGNLIFQKALHRFRPNEKALSEFICYNLYYMSLTGELEQYFTGTTIKHLTGQSLARISIFLPDLPEQTEIVRILDSLFAKEQQAKEAAEAGLEKIDLLKKSILARAFRGELGTNDPNEESAIELLKRIWDTPNESKIPVKRILIPEDLNSRIKTELERKIIRLFVQYDAVSLPTKQIMTISSNKFDIMDALRALQQRGVLCRENDTYKLLR